MQEFQNCLSPTGNSSLAAAMLRLNTKRNNLFDISSSCRHNSVVAVWESRRHLSGTQTVDVIIISLFLSVGISIIYGPYERLF